MGIEIEQELVAEETVATKKRKIDAVPSATKVEEHNFDHKVFTSWCPHCMTWNAEATCIGGAKAMLSEFQL